MDKNLIYTDWTKPNTFKSIQRGGAEALKVNKLFLVAFDLTVSNP